MEVKKLQKRLNIFLGIIIIVFVVLIVSLSVLQIVKGDEYEKLAEENRIRIIPITAPRGVFKDRNGRELVNSRPSFTVSYMSVKTEESTQEEVFATLREILEIPLYTEVLNEKHTVNKYNKITLSKLPIVDKNGDGKVDDSDISIVEETTGKIVLFCIEKNKAIDELTLEEFKSFSEVFEQDVYEEISLEKCVSGRNLPGGPAIESVKAAIENGKRFISSCEI